MIIAEYTIPGMHVRDRVVTVPLDWSRPDDGGTIDVFAREIVDPLRRADDLPLLLYLQGGPGGKSPRPTSRDGFLGAALTRFRVVLLDQRGTGRSSRVQGDSLAGFTPDEAARHLLHFRADSIVKDAEFIREHEFGVARWSTLGQSYGGFLTLSYLSAAPQSLRACYVAGGLASLGPSAEEVYRRTYPRVAAKNRGFYDRYPHDADTIARVAELLASTEVMLPDGDRLSVRRLQLLGNDFGMKPGFDRVHWIFDEAWAGGTRSDPALSDSFLANVMRLTGFDDNPLFMVLQESIYGSGRGATAWAAERERQRHPEFAVDRRPLFLTGEMMFPWMLEEITALRPFAAAAEALAGIEEYPVLYDPERLAANEVPVSAVVYNDDMYVDAGLSLETAGRVGNLHAWVTNEFEHDGLHGPEVAEKLFRYTEERAGSL